MLFSVQTLRKILSLATESGVREIVSNHGDRLGMRMVSLLKYGHQQLPELPAEVLWCLVNFTSVQGSDMTRVMLQNGLVKATIGYVGCSSA